MKPIEKYIFNICRVPESEFQEILEAVGADYSQPKVSKKGVLAWSVLNVYLESPGLVITAVLAVVLVLPFLIFVNIFSA